MLPRGPPTILRDGISVETISIACSDGLILVGQLWKNVGRDGEGFTSRSQRTTTTATAGTATGPASGVTVDTPRTIRILCLHGYLDNCRSFASLAPRLLAYHAKYHQDHKVPQQQQLVELFAADFPGHGQSSHKSLDHPPYSTISDIAVYVAQIVQRLGWKEFVLIGHSMGAMASILYAGTFPEHVQHLVLLDGFGPDFEQPTHVVRRLRQHVLERYEGNTRIQNPLKQKKTYRTINDAIHTRQQTAVKSPGKQWLSHEAAEEMVTWALVEVEGGWQFRHDPRLYWPALQVHTLEQAFDFWKSIRDGGVPTLWLRAKDGWPFSSKWLDRAEAFLGSLGTTILLPGSHHFHLDPDTVDSVAACILEHVWSKSLNGLDG